MSVVGLWLRTEMARAGEAEKWVFLRGGCGALRVCGQNTRGGAAATDRNGPCRVHAHPLNSKLFPQLIHTAMRRPPAIGTSSKSWTRKPRRRRRWRPSGTPAAAVAAAEGRPVPSCGWGSGSRTRSWGTGAVTGQLGVG